MSRAVIIFSLALAACGTTGGGVVTFDAVAGGPADASAASAFDNTPGFHVELSQACFFLGAVYLNMAQPISGSQAEPCTITDGTYVGQAFGGQFAGDARCGGGALDLLSSDLQPFREPGTGTANHVVYAEAWLSSGDIYAPSDPTPILTAAGTATRAGMSWPFTTTVTIGANRTPMTETPNAPGTNPVCAQRIVTPIFTSFTLTDGGTLAIRVDPRVMFANLDFSQLSAGAGGIYAIPDDSNSSNVGAAFFDQVKSASVYQLTWSN